MTTQVKVGGIHHLTLTVSDLERSADFYGKYFGFQVAVDLGGRLVMSNGSCLVVITLPPDPSQAISDDSFNENRIGLDHVSLSVDSRDDLERMAKILDENGVSHGEIKDLGEGLAIYVMAIRDPDNIQLELTAPYAS